MNLSDYTIAVGAILIEAFAKMNESGAWTVMVVDDGKLTGLASEGDVMRALLRGVQTTAQVAGAENRLLQDHAFGLVRGVPHDRRHHPQANPRPRPLDRRRVGVTLPSCLWIIVPARAG